MIELKLADAGPDIPDWLNERGMVSNPPRIYDRDEFIRCFMLLADIVREESPKEWARADFNYLRQVQRNYYDRMEEWLDMEPTGGLEPKFLL